MAPGAADGGSTPPRSVPMYNIIDGKKISNDLYAEYKSIISSYAKNGKVINFVDIQVGNNEASNVYVENKRKKFIEIGINFIHKRFDESINETELVKYIDALNNDNSINAIFVELPLPKHINESNIINTIDYKKDVDGFNIKNTGALFCGLKGFYPCTAEAILELIKRSNIPLSGKHVVVIGRSNIVGKPVVHLLLNENATVTVCHSKTKNLQEVSKSADILIIAMNKMKYINDSFVKDGAVVVDVGIHKYIDNNKNIVCGDVDFENVAPKCSYITPVPGGVGPMTIMMLIKHCIQTISNE